MLGLRTGGSAAYWPERRNPWECALKKLLEVRLKELVLDLQSKEQIDQLIAIRKTLDDFDHVL